MNNIDEYKIERTRRQKGPTEDHEENEMLDGQGNADGTHNTRVR